MCVSQTEFNDLHDDYDVPQPSEIALRTVRFDRACRVKCRERRTHDEMEAVRRRREGDEIVRDNDVGVKRDVEKRYRTLHSYASCSHERINHRCERYRGPWTVKFSSELNLSV
jgi:hypothetical protein